MCTASMHMNKPLGAESDNPPLTILIASGSRLKWHNCLPLCYATVNLNLLSLFPLLCLLWSRHFLPNLKCIYLVRTFSPSTQSCPHKDEHVPREWKMSFLLLKSWGDIPQFAPSSSLNPLCSAYRRDVEYRYTSWNQPPGPAVMSLPL